MQLVMDDLKRQLSAAKEASAASNPSSSEPKAER